MKKDLMIFLFFMAAGAAVFFWIVNTAEEKGSLSTELKQAKTEMIKKERQYVVRQKEEKKREKIYISPHKQRDDVLKLMRAGLY